MRTGPVPETTMPKAGFTLVELAIALMIIGLLIGGVLKGIELVENARVTQTARYMKAVDTAVVSFISIYRGWPGDIINPNRFIANCTTAPCSDSGNLNSRITAGEDIAFWLQLGNAGLISGINLQGTTRDTVYPQTPLKAYLGTFYLSTVTGNTLYTYRQLTPTLVEGAYTAPQAYRLDLKLDDGIPDSGDIRADDDAISGAGCIHASGGYDQTADDKICVFYSRIQA